MLLLLAAAVDGRTTAANRKKHNLRTGLHGCRRFRNFLPFTDGGYALLKYEVAQRGALLKKGECKCI
jgi:hypothetical protein